MNLLDIDRDTFARDFPERGFLIRHRLVNHPLFDIARLVALARELPAGLAEYNAGDLRPGQDPAATPSNGLSVEETVARIEECRSWLVLKHVERVPEYKALLDACLDEVYPLLGGKLTGMHTRAAFIFITSPGGVTPFHFDPEHNFLLQVRGQKTMHQFDRHDRSVLPASAIEEIYLNPTRHRNQPFRDEFQSKAQTFTLHPGDGLFVPVNAPHWVQNGPEVSVSFSITFYSDQIEREVRLHKLNGWMRRRLHINPSPVGQSPWVDRVKHGGLMTLRGLRKLPVAVSQSARGLLRG